MKPASLLYALFFLAYFNITAQHEISLSDYKRAVKFRYENYHNQTVFNAFIRPNWFPDSTGLWYILHSPDGKTYKKIRFQEKAASSLFDHIRLAKSLSELLDKEVVPENLPIDQIEYKTSEELSITIGNQNYTLDLNSYHLSLQAFEKPSSIEELISPNKKWTAYTRDYNLYVKPADQENERQLSTAGTKDYEYASWYGWADIMEGENGERPHRFSLSWSPDSKWISTNICDLRTANKMYLLDWSVDSLYRPKLLSYYRGSPGDTEMVYMEPVFFNIATGKEIKLDLPRSTHINNVGVTWSKDPGKAYLRWTSRGYQNLKLYTFDLEKESLETIYEESSKTNIDNFRYLLAEESNLIFILSERSGWRQLYSLNLETNALSPISNGHFYIHNIERIDEEKKNIYFKASGVFADRNPYDQYLFSISFDGTDMKLLSPEDKHHQISISPCGNYFVDNYSAVQNPTKTVLRDIETGKVLIEMGNAEVNLEINWLPPEAFTAIARDGKTTLYGALWKPSNFDPTKVYPIVESSYTGPHTHVFPTRFSQAFRLQALAELGFIVIVVDGLGSSGRSKAFHDYSYKNLGGNLEDHVLAIKQLGRKYTWLDTTRVGIFGHSAGGYDAAHALLAYPNFYKVAVASSADHDHRMEKAWWPEMYMGWPVDSAYHLQSNITMAGNLKGKLLITHGGIDENVNPSATFKLAEALIKADKEFDLLIFPSQRHGYRGDHQKYFTKKRWNYFIQHLKGVEPIWDFTWE